MSRLPPPLALVGATASGKSALALALAKKRREAEIISVDSMQVYRRMDIGTAKASEVERAAVAHHGIDVVEPWETFTLTDFQRVVKEAIAEVQSRGQRPLLVGGTGLYLRSVIDGLTVPPRFPEVHSKLEQEPDTLALYQRLHHLDPLGASRMEPMNRRRILRALEVTVGSGQPFSSFGPGLESYPPTRFLLVGIKRDRSWLDQKILERYQQQMEVGFLAEVRALVSHPKGLSKTAGQALGYKELAAHLAGEMSLDDALDLAIRRTRQFARRQERWFRRDPRIIWLTPNNATADQSDSLDLEEELLDELLHIWDNSAET